MVQHLVIVESPAKSQTIKKFLGEGYEVKASYGHVVDLPTKGMGIDIEHNFIPQYVVSPEKKRVVSELKSLAKKADQVWIATDEDREGEAIGRHVANQLGLDITKTPRIVFHEITKSAIEKAIQNPRILDLNLVDAQQARRVLDRLVGFELSPVLRRKIPSGGGLSAGRVQSVAVRLIVDREREIQKFEAKGFFKVVGTFIGDAKKPFEAELDTSLQTEKDVETLLETLKTADFAISNIEVKPGKKSPSAPFTTSTLQQEASRKLGFPVAKTMQIAQKLYEAGHITYMRTDSVNLSDFAIKSAQTEIVKEYGKEYAHPTSYQTKTKGSQEAHECIRPTHFGQHFAGNDSSEKKLYHLIRQRTVASQMSPAELEKTKVEITPFQKIPPISLSEKGQQKGNKFIAVGEVIKFDGFLKLYFESSDEENDDELSKGMLPPLKEGEDLKNQLITATEKFKNHPPRYTEASLVKELESQGIGRPSTYAPTISTIQKRNYVVKEDRPGKERTYKEYTLKNGQITFSELKQITGAEKQKLFPTDIGILVTDFLIQHFPKIMDYSFTANVEEEFDVVAEGKLKRNKMISQFYAPFHQSIEQTGGIERVSGERTLWTDPKSWKPLIARMGRYGPMLQIGASDDEEKKYASLPAGQSIETIDLEEALQAFALPRELGEYQGEKVLANNGRFGPYVKWWSLFCSIKKDAEFDLFSITLNQAIQLIEEKKTAEANKYIHRFKYNDEEIQVLNGMYGPYVKYGKKNYKIPKGGKDATDLTLEDTLAIIGKDIKQPDKAETSSKGKGSKARKSHKKTMLSK